VLGGLRQAVVDERKKEARQGGLRQAVADAHVEDSARLPPTRRGSKIRPKHEDAASDHAAVTVSPSKQQVGCRRCTEVFHATDERWGAC
jgi:hypothetical protein